MADIPGRTNLSDTPVALVGVAQRASQSPDSEGSLYASLFAPGSLLARILILAAIVAGVLGGMYLVLFLIYRQPRDYIGLVQCALTAFAFVIGSNKARHGRIRSAIGFSATTAFCTAIAVTAIARTALPISIMLIVACLIVSVPYVQRGDLRRLIVSGVVTALFTCVVYIFGENVVADRAWIGRVFLSFAIFSVLFVVCLLVYRAHGWLFDLLRSLNLANDTLQANKNKLEEMVDVRTGQLTLANGRLMLEVSDRKQAEQRLLEAETQARTERDFAHRVMTSMGEGLILLDHEYHVTYVNPALTQIIGYSAESLIGRHAFDFVLDDWSQMIEYFASIPNDHPAVFEVRAARADGREAWLRVSGGQAIQLEDSVGYLAVVMDITEQRAASARLHMLESAVAKAHDAIMIIDTNPDESVFTPTVNYVNDAFTLMSGYTSEEICGKPLRILEGLKTNTSAWMDGMDVGNAMRDERSTTAEVINYRKDGSEYWVQWTIAPVRDDSGGIRNWIALLRDTTERKRSEALLKRQNAFLAALHEMTVGLINRFESEHLFDAVVERVCKLLDCQHGYIALVDEQQQCLVTTTSFGKVSAEGLPDQPRRKGEGLSGKVWETGEPIWLSNYGQWRGHVPDLVVPYPVAVAPLKSEGRVVGVIGMVRENELEPFQDDEIELLLRFGQLAALVYDNTQLYSAAQHELQERRRIEDELRGQNVYLAALHETTLGLINRLDTHEVLQTVLKRAAELLGTPNAFIDLFDDATGWTRCFEGIGMFDVETARIFRKGEGLSGRVWETGETIIIEDYDTGSFRSPSVPLSVAKAWVGVPLKSGNRVVGAIGMVMDDPQQQLTETKVKTLERFAQLASLTYDNARLYQDAQREIAERTRAEEVLRRQTEFLGALNDTTLGLINRLDLSDLLDTIATRAIGLVGTQHVFIDLFDEESDELAHSLSHGIFRDFPHSTEVTVGGKGLLSRVFITGQLMVIDEYDSWIGRRSQIPQGLLGALVGVPITSNNRVVGVLGMAFQEPGKTFGTDQIEVLSRLGQLASVAYDNAKLYETLRANEQVLERRVEERTHELTQALVENESLRAKSVQAAAAAERSRLARELHDSVSQAIYGIALGARTMQQMSSTSTSSPSAMVEPLNYIVTLADAALAEIRALIFELRPESLEKEGILAALKKQADALRVRYGLQLSLDLCENEPDATLDVKEALYRIALEAMHNTVKHAGASHIYVTLSNMPNAVRLIIRDDGAGFDPSKVGPGSLGTKTMQERVEILKGEFVVQSELGLGTTVSATLPRHARIKS